MKEVKTGFGVVFLALVCAVLVAALDVLPTLRGLPLHGLFVVPVIWVALWSAEEDVLPLTAMAMTVTFLSLASSVISPAETSTTPAHVGERTIVIITIWITVLLALLRKRARRTYKWINLAGKR
jgi:hypothetical protein